MKECKEAIGKEFTGYKGDEFLMGKNTPVWVSNYGQCPNTAIVDIVDKDDYIMIKTDDIEY